MKFSRDFKTSLGWLGVIGVLVLFSVCCAPKGAVHTPTRDPVATRDWPPPARGAYLPITNVKIVDGAIEAHLCSWGLVDLNTAVTAEHCVADAQGWVTAGNLYQAPPFCVDEHRDSAFLVAGTGAPRLKVYRPEVTPRPGDPACYDSFQGRQNCGTVGRIMDGRFQLILADAVVPGESGSVVYTPDGVVGVVSTIGGVVAMLPTTCRRVR